MNSIPHDRTFRLAIDVSHSEIDNLGHVNNVVYVQWIQDASFAHWDQAASAELKRKCKWVVMRHEIDYYAPAFPGEKLEALTWIEPAEGVRQKRLVTIRRLSDQKVIAESITTWCLLDPVSDRPKRISSEISLALGLKD